MVQLALSKFKQLEKKKYLVVKMIDEWGRGGRSRMASRVLSSPPIHNLKTQKKVDARRGAPLGVG